MIDEHEYDRRCIQAAKISLHDEDECIFFDIGANIGNFSRTLIDNFFNKKYKIYAFEPNIEIFNSLKTSFNQYENIIVNNYGLSDKEEEKILYLPGNLSVLGSVYNRKVFSDMKNNWGEISSRKILLRTLDSVVNDYNIEKISYLKIDTEGHELSVLNGATRVFEQKKVFCGQVEYGGCYEDSNIKLIDIYKYLNYYEYNLYDLSDYSLITHEKATKDDFYLRNYFFINSKKGLKI